MIRFCRVALALVLVTSVLQNTAAAQDDGWRTIEFETTEVTAPDVAVSPDGEWLIFTMLGHLFRLPVEGGTAEQLTFGPYYDSDVVFSSDGGRVAFVSDRDGSEGNVFVLKLATGDIKQVTHELWASRPTWTPDGEGIVYLSIIREARAVWGAYGEGPMPALVRWVSLGGGEPETISTPPRLFRSVFYLPDGRLAWTVIERETESARVTTRFEAIDAQGVVLTLHKLEGFAEDVIASPSRDGLYLHRSRSGSGFQPVDLLFLSLPEAAEREILPMWSRGRRGPRSAVAPDGKTMYLGENGRLWKLALSSGVLEPVDFRARVSLEIQDPVPPPKWSPPQPGTSARPRSVVSPRLSPDGSTLVFVALAHIWRQSLDGGPADRLFEGKAFEWDPAFSPGGRRLAFVYSESGRQEVRLFDFDSGRTRTLASGATYSRPSWSRDGQRLVFVEYEPFQGGWGRLVAVGLVNGKKENLGEIRGWIPRPHFSPNGESLYYTANTTDTATLYRLPLEPTGQPEPMTQLDRHLSEGLVSPDGRWLAFRRGMGIWLARLGPEPVREEHVRRLSPEGGDTFVFAPDASAVIYSVGSRVWRHPLQAGQREEIPIRLAVQGAMPPPLLLRRVRVLDFAAGGFRQETSVYIERGRIRWIGPQGGRELPSETMILDAAGRFAIPGLFDAHVHSSSLRAARPYPEAYLAYGITSLRDTGGWLSWQNTMSDRSEASSDPLPRYFFSGDAFEDASSVWGDYFLQIFDEDEARDYVRRWKERGAHFIKAYFSLPWRRHRAVAEEARRVGLPVVGHGMSPQEIIRSVILGFAGLEHTTWPGRVYDDVLQMLAAAGTRWDPTLGAAWGDALLTRDEPERLRDPKHRAFSTHPAQLETGTWVDPKPVRGAWHEQLAAIRAAHRIGVGLQAGTDSGIHTGYGWRLHWELEHFVQAGLSPLDVLRIATQEGAAAVGAEDDLGTLEVGKLADIVLLDANPLDDIKNTQTIWRVIKGGWVFDPEKLRPDRN